MSVRVEALDTAIEGFRQKNGKMYRVDIETKLGKATFRGKVIFDSGREKTGVLKIYSSKDGGNWDFAACKQMSTLNFLHAKKLSSGWVMDVDEYVSQGYWGIMVLREEIKGKTIRQREEPVQLSEARKLSGKLFEQLGAVSNDKALIEMGMGYCGDISPGNVVEGDKGYSIIEWDGQLGQVGMPDITAGYVAPEVVSDVEGETVSQVLADTYSLGCVLARVLMGKTEWRKIAPVGDFSSSATFEKVAPNLLPDTHDFFRKVLAMDPLDRMAEGADSPGKHYRGLGKMFGVR